MSGSARHVGAAVTLKRGVPVSNAIRDNCNMSAKCYGLWLCGDELPTVMGSKTDIEQEELKYSSIRWMDKTIEEIDEQQEQEYRTAGVPYIT